jgi:hypothetical protein
MLSLMCLRVILNHPYRSLSSYIRGKNHQEQAVGYPVCWLLTIRLMRLHGCFDTYNETAMYFSTPKQSAQQIMPGIAELQDLHQQIQAVTTALELTPAAQQLIQHPQTAMQRQLQRRLLRLQAAQQELAHAEIVLGDLSGRASA